MFVARRVGLRPIHPGCSRLLPRAGHKLDLTSRRTFLSSAVEVLSEGFLDLAIALPLPPSLPPYSTTIILVTVVSRLAFTLPFSIWAQKRRWRLEDVVKPELERIAPKVTEEIIDDLKKKGVFAVTAKQYQDKAELAKRNADIRDLVRARSRKMVEVRQKELLDKYNCRPRATTLIPIVTQLPLFFLASIVFSHISQSPTPFDSESFLTLTNLSHTDPTTTLPIVLGFLTLANVESSSWFMTDAQRQQKVAADEKYNKALVKSLEEGKIHFEGGRVIKSGLRFGSVARVIIAAMVPGGVVLYWLSSAAFGLLQTWAFDYWNVRRRRRLPTRALKESLPTPSRR